MADLFSTGFLAKVVEKMNRPSSFLLDMYFPEVQTHATEEINFDLVTQARSLAPLVSPMVEGQVVQEQGMTTKTIKPAYVKAKTPLAAAGALKRMAGEQIGGNMSPEARQLARIAKTIEAHIYSVTRRKEWMASAALRTGAVVLTGDKFPTQNINFGRDASLTVTLAGAARWGEAGVEPLDDIQTWALAVLDKGSVAAGIITMDIKAWQLFRASSKVQKQLDTRNIVGNQMASQTQMQRGGVFQGNIGNLFFYTYSAKYVDDAGITQDMIPDHTVILGGAGIEGVQAHGAILDEEAGIQALEFFSKSWVSKDPGQRQVLTQSAPLVVPCNVNGCACATVR